MVATTACGLFEELQSADSAEGDTTGSTTTASEASGSSGTQTCSFPQDDRCADQDTVQACLEDGGEPQTYDCGALCGSFINFTCLGVGNGQHGCWCVEPGLQKVLSCSELESCLAGCVNDLTGVCADGCFSRTTEATLRMYGSLVFCAYDTCHETCTSEPDTCTACIDSAIQSGGKGCALPRSVCDSDENDES